MTETTALDTAHSAMMAAPGNDAARLRFFERLADSELFLLLTEEAGGDNLSPEVFELDEGRFVLVFDREERLARFTGKPAPYAALSGRVLAGMLSGQGIGLGLNLDVGPSSILVPAEALDWLTATLAHVPDEVRARIVEVAAPLEMPEDMVAALDAKLATAGGLADAAYLVDATYADGGRGSMLALIDAVPQAQGALSKAVAEALVFSGRDAAALDVGFFAAADPVSERFARVGLRFDLPQPQVPTHAPTMPGRDPGKPPILK